MIPSFLNVRFSSSLTSNKEQVGVSQKTPSLISTMLTITELCLHRRAKSWS